MTSTNEKDSGMQPTTPDSKSQNLCKKYLNWGCLGWSLWAGLLLFFGQSTWASLYENEIRAAIIYAAFVGILLFGGIIVYFSRRYNQHRR